MNLRTLYQKVMHLNETPEMPMLFVGHGTPMNAIEENIFSMNWKKLAHFIPAPSAILCISAHWQTQNTRVTAAPSPKTIHDFYGFPDALYQQNYPAKGDPALAQAICDNVSQTSPIELDYDWGIDHGSWSVLKHIYPNADIPVLQLSLDETKDSQAHFQLAQELTFLRKRGVLIIGSGNMIHNLRMIQVKNDFNAPYAYDWALDINQILKEKILQDDLEALIHYPVLHPAMSFAVPTPEHYLPLLYVLALKNAHDNITIFNDRVIAASLSMTSLFIGSAPISL